MRRMPSSLRSRFALAAVTSVVAAASVPASAAAETLAYVDAGHVYLTDGKRVHRVTSGAPGYDEVAQGADGSLIVRRGDEFRRVAPDGTPLGPPINIIGGRPALAPDGRTLAVETNAGIYFFDTTTGGPSPVWPTESSSLAGYPTFLANGWLLYSHAG